MLKAILFDLDDTLLGNSMDTFLPRYFDLIGQHAARFMPRETFIAELLTCTQAMVQNVDPQLTNRELFWRQFEARTGLAAAELEPFFDQFYRNQFQLLQSLTVKRPFAAKLVAHCLERGLDVVIATNPLFPGVAIDARLAWAGLPVTHYNFALVTTYENMHAAKPQTAYYTEILQKIDCAPENALMVGNDWENDILPARQVGIHTYWLSSGAGEMSLDESIFHGDSLEELFRLLEAGWQPAPT